MTPSEALKQYCIKLFAYHLPDCYKEYHESNLFALKYEYKAQKIQVFNDWSGIERSLFDHTAVNVSLNASSPTKTGFFKIKNTPHGIQYSFIDSLTYLQQSTPLFSSLQDDGIDIYRIPVLDVNLKSFDKIIPANYSNPSTVKDIIDLCSSIPNLVKSQQEVKEFAEQIVSKSPSLRVDGGNGARIINEYRKYKALK
jgi:hypothetical protein